MKISLFILCLFLSLISYANGGPSIDDISPAWGLWNGYINLVGTGFTPGTTTVTINSDITCVIQTITPTLITCSVPTAPTTTTNYGIVVTSNGVESSLRYYRVVTMQPTNQINNIFYFKGSRFDQIPNKSQIIAKNSDGSYTTSVTYVDNNTLTLIMNLAIAQKGPIQLFDNTFLVAIFQVQFAPVITTHILYKSTIILTGYVFTADTTITQPTGTIITSQSSDKMTINPPPTFFLSYLLMYTVRSGNGQTTSISLTLKKLSSYSNSVDSDTCYLTLVDFDNTATTTTTTISGITTTPFTPITVSPPTSIQFTYPPDAQCGDLFVSGDITTSYQRITNSLVACPNPLIQNIIAYPDVANNFIKFNGKFLNYLKLADIPTQAMTFSIEYGSGIPFTCTFVSQVWVPANSTYTTICQIPSDAPITSFKLSAIPLIGEKSSIFVGYTPSILSATSTAYGVSGQVTISGSRFSSFDLEVTIGGTACTNPVASLDGTSITCTFAGSVPVVDFSVYLEVMVSVGGTYVDRLAVFRYIRPSPTIVSITTTYYHVPGSVIISGTYLQYSSSLYVTIGGAQCTSPVVGQNGNIISCNFASDVPISDINSYLEIVVDIDGTYSIKSSIFKYVLKNPIVLSSTSTPYNTPGQITIRGLNYYNFNLLVLIAGSPCTNAIASQNAQEITCDFPSNVPVPDINTPISVTVIIAALYNTSASIFKYSLLNPTITSCSSTYYSIPQQITIIGSNFYNFDLQVKVGQSICSNAVASQDSKQIICDFKSDVQVSDINTPLDVFVSMNSLAAQSTNAVFYYSKPIEISITSSTSTKQNVEGLVTITGSNFFNDNLQVNIGGSICTNAIATQDTKQIVCSFKSDVTVPNINTPLDVFVSSVHSIFNSTQPVFIYTKPDKTCPIGINGQVCSGHGACNQQFTCDCDKGWESSLCTIRSIPEDNNGGIITIPEPSVNENDTSSSIITPSGTMFDVGIVLINEIDINNNNNIVQSFNVSNIKWNNITKDNNKYIYTTTLDNNDKSLLIVQLTINNLDERVYYNFAGDIIPILPKSIKYQIELQNYTFSSSLNTMQFIFKSGIIKEGGDCVYDQSTDTETTTGDTIRTVQMTLNGETLIGTFSDRIILDSRPSYNQVNKLTNDQITKYNLNTQSLYISITTTSFKKTVIVDPNFGVLVSSNPEQDKCNTSKFPAWKIAVIAVCSAIGVALVTTIILLKKRKIVQRIQVKLQDMKSR